MSYYFDGVDDRLETPSHSSLAVPYPLTAAIWVKFDGTTGHWQGIWGNRAFVDGWRWERSISEDLRLNWFTGNTAIVGIPAPTGWALIVGRHTGTTRSARIYLADGSLFTSPSESTTTALNYGAWPFFVGWDGFDSLKGYAAHPAVWDRALSDTECDELGGGASPLDYSPSEYWPLTESGELTGEVAGRTFTNFGATFSTDNPPVGEGEPPPIEEGFRWTVRTREADTGLEGPYAPERTFILEDPPEPVDGFELGWGAIPI